jgi:hypothetical protein
MPRHDEWHFEHPGDGDPEPARFQPLRVYQIRANEPALAGQRPDFETKLFEPLSLGRDLWTEHPDLVAALLQPGGDARYVTADAPGTGSQ